LIASDKTGAIVMDRYGPPQVLAWRPVSVPLPGPKEVRIRTLFAAVNHTDLTIRAGLWPIRSAEPFPYIPGVEVVGLVDAVGQGVSEFSEGQAVITMMQGLGGVRAERPGAYATFVTVRKTAVSRVPTGVDLAQVAALGLGGVTAFEGLRRLGAVAGRRLLVTGAAGGVGSAAVAIARMMGARVEGLVSRPSQIAYVQAQGAERVIVAARGTTPQLADRYDSILDTVAGSIFGACVKALSDGGALCMVGAVGGGAVDFDGWDLIRPVTLTGYSTETLDGAALRRAVEMLGAGLRAGVLTPPRHEILPLEDAAEAHRKLDGGGFGGRILLASPEGLLMR
jgi:NADPH2:quinone reductase